MKYFQKKAVSPLIATVVLLVVVVGVGAVVTGMIRGYITESKQKTDESAALTSCSTELDIDTVIINEDIQVCKNSTHIEFMIENRAGEIDDFQVSIYSSDNIVQNTSVLSSSESLAQGETKLFSATYSGMSASDIVEVHLIPKLRSPQGTMLVCNDVALKIKNPRDC